MFNAEKKLLSVAVALALTACGGSGSSPTVSSGKAVDGYLGGATAICDVNNNGVADTGEATVTTSATGDYSFSPACGAVIVVKGGTNIDTGFVFKGQLKAPAASTVVTPLTTLITGKTPAEVAATLASLGLPADTDLTKTDPADGKHFELMKVTLAVQQIVQQLANSFASVLGTTDTATLYLKVAEATGKALASAGNAPLLGANGVVNTAVLRNISTAAVTAAGAAEKISSANLDALADQVAVQAQTFAQATSSDILLSTSKQFQNPSAPLLDVTAGTKFLALEGDSLSFNGTAVSLATLATGISVDNFTSLGIQFDTSRGSVVNTSVGMFLELSEQAGGDDRKLQIMIDKVNVAVSAAGAISIAPATTAKVYVYGHTSNGTDINLTLNDLTFKPLTVVDNKISLNFDAIVNKVLASSSNTTATTASKFTNIAGNFNTKIVVSNLNIRHDTTEGAAFDSFTVSVNGSSLPTTMTGRGIVGKVSFTQP
jgi:hypothetical protein